MNVYEAIAARRTVRDFDARPVAKHTLRRMLEAGVQAPSSDHLRDWHFILVDNRDQREELVRFFRKEWTSESMEAWLNTMGLIPESQRAMYRDAVPKQAEMLLHAGALVIPCFQESESLLGEKSSLHELNAFASMWAVIENILIAGASEGVHGVTKIISTPTERDHVRTTLAIPESYEIPCYLALGYPHEHTFRPEQIPVRLEERIHINRWPS